MARTRKNALQWQKLSSRGGGGKTYRISDKFVLILHIFPFFNKHGQARVNDHIEKYFPPLIRVRFAKIRSKWKTARIKLEKKYITGEPDTN